MKSSQRNILTVALNIAVLGTFLLLHSFSAEAGARLVAWFAAMVGGVFVASWLADSGRPLLETLVGLAMPTYVLIQLLSRPYPSAFIGAALAGGLLCTLIVLYVPVNLEVAAGRSPGGTNPPSNNGPR